MRAYVHIKSSIEIFSVTLDGVEYLVTVTFDVKTNSTDSDIEFAETYAGHPHINDEMEDKILNAVDLYQTHGHTDYEV